MNSQDIFNCFSIPSISKASKQADKKERKRERGGRDGGRRKVERKERGRGKKKQLSIQGSGHDDIEVLVHKK